MLPTIFEVEEENDESVVFLPSHEVDLDASWSENAPAELSVGPRASTPVPVVPDDPLELSGLEKLLLSWHWRSSETPSMGGNSSFGSSLEDTSSYISDWRRPLHNVTFLSLDGDWAVERGNDLFADVGEQPSRGSPAGSFTSDVDIYESSYEIVGESDLCFIRPSGFPTYSELPALFSPIDLSRIWKFMPPTLLRVFTGRSHFTLLKRHTSVDRRRLLSKEDHRTMECFINDMLKHKLIVQAKRCSFVSYPFIIAKSDGSARVITDYGHLKAAGVYSSPTFFLPPLLAIEPNRIELCRCSWYCKIDLKSAFYAVPLPQALRKVSTFAFGGKRYQFKVLPIGLYISPYILQTILKTLLHRFLFGIWIHIDDLLLFARSRQELVRIRAQVVSLLRGIGFTINVQKSALKPTQTIIFCGLIIKGSQYALTSDKLDVARKLLFEQADSTPFWKCFGKWRNTIRKY